MIAGSALAGAVLFSQLGDRTDVLVVSTDVAKGQVITEGDLQRQSVAGVDAAIPVGAIDTVVGTTAKVDMVAGQIVTDSMVTRDPVPGDGQATVGLSLDAARAPSTGLSAGDLVSVVVVPSGTVDLGASVALDAPQILARGAEVLDVQGSPTDGATVLVTVIVDEDDASTIAAYSAAGLVAVVETAPTGN
ncbi:SAF domain-containing protein [Aeromicrobium sp.]|uniref:SAF domain-containing protein n=1 Tax=Aeromicrobium sp. TaxID=1871063 RepID=UPI0025BE6692|nr:SAF domain-containing protein [Aeromicrobium sp.]MCK5891694.1 flagella basal body P-ring formation protein FlgA [Aeromicrobium sp.]